MEVSAWTLWNTVIPPVRPDGKWKNHRLCSLFPINCVHANSSQLIQWTIKIPRSFSEKTWKKYNWTYTISQTVAMFIRLREHRWRWDVNQTTAGRSSWIPPAVTRRKRVPTRLPWSWECVIHTSAFKFAWDDSTIDMSEFSTCSDVAASSADVGSIENFKSRKHVRSWRQEPTI